MGAASISTSQDRTLRTTWARGDGQRPLRSEHAWVSSRNLAFPLWKTTWQESRLTLLTCALSWPRSRHCGPSCPHPPSHLGQAGDVHEPPVSGFAPRLHGLSCTASLRRCSGAQGAGVLQSSRATSHPPRARPCLPSDVSVHPFPPTDRKLGLALNLSSQGSVGTLTASNPPFIVRKHPHLFRASPPDSGPWSSTGSAHLF